MMVGEVFACSKSPKSVSSFTLFKAGYGARIESLQGRFWPSGFGVIFDTPDSVFLRFQLILAR